VGDLDFITILSRRLIKHGCVAEPDDGLVNGTWVFGVMPIAADCWTNPCQLMIGVMIEGHRIIFDALRSRCAAKGCAVDTTKAPFPSACGRMQTVREVMLVT
jgi:hypothetical protein